MSGSLTDVAGPREPYRPPGGSLLYLSRDDLESLGVTMLEVVDAVERGCAAKGRGEVVMPPKLSLHGEGDAYSQVMAATLPGDGGLGAKWVTLFPQNAAAGLPITNGLVVLSDPGTGLPPAVMDAGAITAWRTGASVGVAARYLARAGRRPASGVLGCGVQARAAVRALAAVLPGLRAVRCHDAVDGRRRRVRRRSSAPSSRRGRVRAVPRRRRTWRAAPAWSSPRSR